MERTQISLEPEQAERLRRLASERGVSMARLIREAIDRVYGAASEDSLDARWERAFRFINEARFHSGVDDIAEQHDKYLDEIYSS